jgi:hypothetical protein
MTWFKVDDGLCMHPKWIATPPAARGLWVTAGSWCGGQENDGLVPRHVLAMLGGKPKDAAALVAAGLWLEDPEGWRFHDWLAMQPSSRELRERRDKVSAVRSQAGRKGAEARWQTDGKADGKPMASVSPDPTRPEGTPQPPAERGAKEAHAGQHANCRACGTTRRALAPVYSHPHVPYPIPDADEWLTKQRDIPVSRPPEGWREQMRSAEA